MQPDDAFDSPSDRLIRSGIDALTAEELIALVLQRGQRGEDGLVTARRLARDFGSLSRLGRARPEELASLSGLTPEQAAALVSGFRLARIVASERVPARLTSAKDVAAVAMRELEGATRERTVVLVCDAAHYLLRPVSVSEGSVDRAFLPVREILSAVLRHDGRAFAVAHNHPSADATPSDADVLGTENLRRAAPLVGLRFLDHVIVAGTTWSSIVSR